MCIIIAKGAGIPAPSLEIFERAWDNNPDGAGIAFQYGGRVQIEKGFMDKEEFLKNVLQMGDVTKMRVVYHLRIATHGSVSPGNTHPFPVSAKDKDLRALYRSTTLAVAHNGVIAGYGSLKGDLSDTVDYIKNALAPLYGLNNEFYKHWQIQDMIEYATWSKFAFLPGRGEIVTIGDFIEDEGVLYSNTSYRQDRLPIGWGGELDDYSPVYRPAYSYNPVCSKKELKGVLR